jgi:pimeloyl-ACP methyl ester carboxylesterase
MTEPAHRTVETNGIRMHIAEQGSGPLVLLCHGFPESWYSWRHQLRALAEAGFRAVAPDMRGYGQTDRPQEIEKYTLFHLVGDMVGLLDVLGAEQAVIAGHDWGAPVAWHAALMRPDRFRGVIGLSVPFRPRGPVAPTTVMPQRDDAAFYQLYFQTPGMAEAELERDAKRTIRSILYSASGDAPRHDGGGAVDAISMVPRQGGFLTRMVAPTDLPPWLSEHDVAFYAGEFARTGFRGGLSWYRNIDRNWGIAGSVRRRAGHRPCALHGWRPRPCGELPWCGSAHCQPDGIRASAPPNHHVAGVRPLDPAGTSGRGQCRHNRLPAQLVNRR